MELGYEGWMKFNVAQRINYNYLESIQQMLTCMILCGLNHTMATVYIGSVYLFARIFYQVGYKCAGPKGRLFAAPIVMLTQLFFPIFTIYSLVDLAG